MKQVKVGIIGFGFMGTTHFRIHSANPKSKIVAIADADEDKRKGDIRKVHGNIGGDVNDFLDLTGIKVYEDGMDLINDPEVEEVDICAPTYLHAKFAIAALKAGKHVLLEKPAALTVEDVQAVMDQVSKSKTCFTVGLCVRAWPEYRKAFDELSLKPFNAVGEKFDPSLHDAVAHESSEEIEEGVVSKQWNCGFKLGEKVLRPARVVVSSGAPKEEDKKEE